MVCNERCEVFSRVVGYFRPVQNWNNGKQEEFRNRVEFDEGKALAGHFASAKPVLSEESKEVC